MNERSTNDLSDVTKEREELIAKLGSCTSEIMKHKNYIAELTRAIEQLIHFCEPAHIEYPDQLNAWNRVKMLVYADQRDRWIESLSPYLHHLSNCDFIQSINRHSPMKPCSCGLDAALKSCASLQSGQALEKRIKKLE